MKKGLIYKIQIKVLTVLSICLIILGVVLSVLGSNFLKDEKRESINREVYPIINQINNYLRAQENSSLSNLQSVVNTVSNAGGLNIAITDNLGYIYAVSNEEEIAGKYKLSSKIVTSSEKEHLKLGNIIEEYNEGQYIYMQPVFNEDYFGGILIVRTSTDDINSKISKLTGVIALSIVFLIILISFVIRYFVNNMVIQPINEINKMTKNISMGQDDNKLSILKDDEIGDLAKSFNVMTETINQIDISRRDFISNASHELRSPITSIRGFIAGIIDGIIPKDKEMYYLNIVYDEVKRLSRLVDDLLDISTLDNANYNLNKVEEDINGLIKLCLANKESRLIEEDLSVEVILESDHRFVFVDRDRMIQVITNLLDNAIKYSYKGNIIKVETKVKGEKVYVTIQNRGQELSEEELIKIWDRFYKADSSRTNKESTGLGLPIVRTILARHGEEIWVKNDNGETTFTFTLTRV